MKTLAAGSVGLVVAVMAVNAGNYGLNLLLANTLEPSEFGDASLLVTFLLVTGVLAATIQLATSIAILREPERRDRHVRSMRLFTNRIGWIGGLLLLIISPLATNFLQVDSSWALFVMAAGFPLHVQLAVERGRLQGDLALGRLAGTFLAEGAARILTTVIILAVIPSVGALAVALNLGFIGGYIVCRPRVDRWSWLDLARPAENTPSGSVGLAVVAVTLLTNLDVVAAKGVFDPADAGSFAALALGGRVVFFTSWTLQQALLPLVLSGGSSAMVQRRRLFLGGNAILCAAMVTVAWVWAEIWVDIAFGSAYEQIASLFGVYALGTGLICIAAAFAMLQSTDGNDRSGHLLLLGAALLPTVLLARGESLEAFVEARVAALMLLTLAVGCASKVSNRVPQRATSTCRPVQEGAFS